MLQTIKEVLRKHEDFLSFIMCQKRWLTMKR